MMQGQFIVASSDAEATSLLAAQGPRIHKRWAMSDFADFHPEQLKSDEQTIVRGMQAFMQARCMQCHVMAGHGVPLGPELTKVRERYQGEKLLKQLIEPSSEINKKFQTYRFLLDSGKTHTGVIVKETPDSYEVASNLLTPEVLTRIQVRRRTDEGVQDITHARRPGGCAHQAADPRLGRLPAVRRFHAARAPKTPARQVEGDLLPDTLARATIGEPVSLTSKRALPRPSHFVTASHRPKGRQYVFIAVSEFATCAERSPNRVGLRCWLRHAIGRRLRRRRCGATEYRDHPGR